MSTATMRAAALRALAEGAVAELDLLAAATGRSAEKLKRLAAREGWLLGSTDAELDRRLRRLLDNLVSRLERLVDRMERDGEDADLKAITAEIANLLRSIDKLQAMLPGTEKNNNNKDKDAMLHDAEARDRELARLHELIDDRIAELAAEAAAGVVAAHTDGDGSTPAGA